MKRGITGVLACALVCGVAAGSKPSLRLERIDPSSFADGGKVRLFASLVELEGQVDDGKAAHSFSLRIDGKKALAPERVEPFRMAAVPLDLVLVIESAALYGVQKLPAPSGGAGNAPGAPAAPTKGTKGTKLRRGKGPAAPAPAAPAGPAPTRQASGELPLDHVKDALATLLEGRPAKTRVLVVDYGGEVTPHPPFRPAPAAQGAIEELSPDDESGDLHLVDAVRAALLELNRTRPDDGEAPPRRLIVVVSDGLNAQMDRKTFRALGDAAAIARVPIHSIAFSPADDRGPLLNLGEISKRSNGTFRWARTADELRGQIETLADELDKQYVLTFSLPLDALEGHSFQLRCEDLASNVLRYEAGGSVFGYTGPTQRRSRVWLVLGWAGGVLGGLLLLAVIATLIGRARRGRRAGGANPVRGGAATRLVFLDGSGRSLLLDPRAAIVIGKDRGAFQLSDAAVSGRHAQLSFDGRGWLLTDLGSTNGSWVDGQRIALPTYLGPGSVIQLGQTRLRLEVT